MKKILTTNIRWLFLSLLVAASAGKAWGDTVTLTNANIVSAGNVVTGYQSWTLTDENSNTWNAYAIKNKHSNETSSYHYLQIKKYASNTAYYVQVPALGVRITSITMTVSNASQPMTGGSNTATLFFSASNTTSATGTGVASGTGSSSITIDCSSLNLNTGYITASASVRIWDVTITYETKILTEVTFPESSYEVTYPGSFSAPPATVKETDSGTTISSATVTYTSSNTSVATINSSTGAVTLAGVGSTTITATYAGNDTYNGSTGSYTLTVNDGRAATTTSFPSNSYEAVLGESFTSPTATVSPSAATGSVTYSSNNTAVATVDINTGEVSLEGVGTAIITATYPGDTNYKNSSASYTLTVSNSGGGSSYTWDLSISSYLSATTDQIEWTSTFASMTYVKASGSSTGANNYIPPTRTSTRFYTGGTLTIAPEAGYKIKSIVFTATTEGYANTFTGSSWANATASVSGTTVTITPTSGLSSVIATVGGTCGFTGVTVYYELTSITAPDAPTLTASCTFWPQTTETPSKTVTIAPTTTGSYVRYTTDGTDPTTTSGTLVTTSQNLTITATTTVKAIAYIGSSTSSIATATYTLGQTVNSIAAFKALTTGTEARLYLDPENNARVLHASGSEIYVRDNTGAICIYLASSLQNPVPQHDYHVAGWIIGKYQPYNGLPEMVATSNTTTDYLAFAAPVTEAATEPVAISANDFDDYKADWVTITDLRAEDNGDNINVSDDDANTLKVYNKYNLNNDSYYQDPYDGALVDLTGLAVPYNSTKEIVPIYYNNARPIIYVIDENKEFRSPSVDIQNATVRLVRTLSNTNWNTFVIPMYMENFEGTIRRYDRAEGTTMMFVDEYGGIEAGMPYLVKPINRIENPVYSNVTLCAQTAKNIEADGYKFVGIYSPENIYEESKVNRFLKSDGYLYYPTDENAGRLKGLRAYFVVPDGTSNVKVNPDGTATIIDEVQSTMYEEQGAIYDVSGRVVGNDMHSLPRGIYIVNGKKIVVR